MKRFVAGTTVPMMKNDAKLEIIAKGNMSLMLGINIAMIENTTIAIQRPKALPQAIFNISDDDFRKRATNFFDNLTNTKANEAYIAVNA